MSIDPKKNQTKDEELTNEDLESVSGGETDGSTQIPVPHPAPGLRAISAQSSE